MNRCVFRALQVRLLEPLAQGTHACLLGDPDRLKGVLLNLYSNAAKFTRTGFLSVRIRNVAAADIVPGKVIDPRESYLECLEAHRVARAEGPRLPRRRSIDVPVNAGRGKDGGVVMVA